MNNIKTFDYIVVGAGAAGCVLANRLSRDRSVSVALLESGSRGNHPFVSMPKGLAKIMNDPKLTWRYQTEAEAGNGFESETWARGRLLGGSSAINGMMYVRGQPDDFNLIAEQTSPDWSWEHIGRCFSELENHQFGADLTRGGSGPLKVTIADTRNPLLGAMIKAGAALGWKTRDDFNAPDNEECIAYAPRTIWKGKRQSAYTAFIEPILNRPNLTIITGATVDRVKFKHRKAVGVIYVDANNCEQQVNATNEVVIAGGAMSSPGILQRSGIGPTSLLNDLGIDVVQDAPQVGQNLQEHRIIMVQWKLNSPFSENSQYSGWRLLKNVAKYYAQKSGPMSSAAFDIAARMKSSPDVDRPDIQFIIAPYSFDFQANREKLEVHPGMNVACHPLRPTSRGYLHIASRDPASLPKVVPNYRDTEQDRQLMIATVTMARRYAAQSPLADIIECETYPGPEAVSDAEVIDAYDRYASCGYHAVGTCRMGNDDASVVDPELKVRGVSGLRIMDTSVMPQIPSGNTCGPTMVMAWRAAELILTTSQAES